MADIPAMLRPVLAAVVLCLVACTPRDANTWHPAPPGGTPAPREQRPGEASPRSLAVVFAPVAIGQLAAIYPDARIGFAYDLADRIDVLGSKADADGLAAPDTPDSDDAAWSRWPNDAMRGADLVVLTTMVSLERHESVAITRDGKPITVTAIVEMRALDSYGNVVFKKRGRGDWQGTVSPKYPSAQAKPESQASWEACSNAVGALLGFLEHRNEAAAGGPTPTGEQLVEVQVSSDPEGADVLVDGIFRGSTPCTLKLPLKRLSMRIQRSGYETWEQVMVPDAAMRIRPALDRKAP
jgi:hypothetical protein